MGIGSLLVGCMAGGLVGLGHSWVMIKLIFWPLEPVFLFGRQLPLTPGLFIAGKERFAVELSAMLEDRFLTPTGVHRALGQVLDSNVMKETIERRAKEAVTDKQKAFSLMSRAAERMISKHVDSDKLKTVSAHLSEAVVASGAVHQTVKLGIQEMSPQETERMVMKIVHKELKAVLWLGVPLGAASVLSHELLKWILSLW